MTGIADVLAGRRDWWIEHADVMAGLRSLPDESVHCVVTSPPYWGLRDYGVPGQIGLEPTHIEYVERMVEVFREVRRVLRRDGTLWLNLGDAFAGSWGAQSREGYSDGSSRLAEGSIVRTLSARQLSADTSGSKRTPGLKPKDLIGLPWHVAFALQADGWWLRSDIVWHKPNPMPESVTDRPTKAHEYVFLMSKNARYYYDADAIRENLSPASVARFSQDVESQNGSLRAHAGGKTNGPMRAVARVDKQRGHGRRHAGFNDRWDGMSKDEQAAGGRNKRSVWTIATVGFPDAHFVFPPALVEPCILAGCPEGGVVLDPFSGAGTTAMVALRHGRRAIGLELNAEYVELARRRIVGDAPMFNAQVEAAG